MNRGQQLSLLGAIGLLVGAFLPWVSASSILGISISKAGYEGDGIITGGIGLLLLLGAILSKGKPGKTYSIATAFLAIISGLILMYDLSNVNSVVSNASGSVVASIGPGIYVSIVGAILALFGGLQKVPSLPEAPQIQPPVT